MTKKHGYIPEAVRGQSEAKEKLKRDYAAMKLSSAGITNETADTTRRKGNLQEPPSWQVVTPQGDRLTVRTPRTAPPREMGPCI